MVRKPTPPSGPRLEALLDERDHIRIRISMELDKKPKEMIDALYGSLADVEKRIDAAERFEKGQP